MWKRRPAPDHARLLELFHYGPDTGHFYWSASPNSRIRAGARAGCVTKRVGGTSYRQISVDGQIYYEHHLAWFYVNGVWPDEIDHRDLDGENNRLGNLRECSRGQNNANCSVRKTNTLGIKGVTQLGPSVYRARVWQGDRYVYLGRFSSSEEAHAAYVAAAVSLFGEFARAA